MSSMLRFMTRFIASGTWRAGRTRRRFASLGVVILAALLSPAAHASDRDICQIGDPANAGLGLAEIKPSKGIDLSKVEAPCPDDSGQCKSQIHLKKHELVITTGRVSGPYVCVYVAGSDTDVGGYVKQTDIAPRPPDRPLPLSAWKGKWSEGFGNWIRLRVEGTALDAEGEAFYPSAHPSRKDFPGGPNMGDMSGVATPHDNIAVFDPDGCRVIVALDKSRLFVSASGGPCYGMNVSFSGYYYK